MQASPNNSFGAMEMAMSEARRVLTFDRLSSVLLSNTNHEENPPGTLPMRDAEVPIKTNLALYGAPEPSCASAGIH